MCQRHYKQQIGEAVGRAAGSTDGRSTPGEGAILRLFSPCQDQPDRAGQQPTEDGAPKIEACRIGFGKLSCGENFRKYAGHTVQHKDADIIDRAASLIPARYGNRERHGNESKANALSPRQRLIEKQNTL